MNQKIDEPRDQMFRVPWLALLLGLGVLAPAVAGASEGYVSRSAVQETPLDELSTNKIQVTLGIQRLYRGNIVRFGITENLANFDNTPDVGINLSVARILFGPRGSKSLR